MNNSLGRNVVDGFKPFIDSNDYKNHLNEYKKINEKKTSKKVENLSNLEELFDKYEYAIIDKYENRTDITYEQILTLEDLVKEYPINDTDLILSIIMTESRGIETAQNSESTAKGYGQLLNSTAKLQKYFHFA